MPFLNATRTRAAIPLVALALACGGKTELAQDLDAFADGGESWSTGGSSWSTGGSSVGATGGVNAGGAGAIAATGGFISAGGVGMPTGGTGGTPPYCAPADLGDALGTGITAGVQPRSGGTMQGACGGRGPETSFSWTAPWDGQFTFDTVGSGGDTVLTLLSGTCTGGEITCNDDSDGYSSLVTADFRQGERIVVVVDTYADTGGDYFQLNVSGVPYGATDCSSYELGSTASVNVARSFAGATPGLETCSGSGGADVFSWTAPFSASYRFSTAGSDFDTVLDVRRSCQGESLACNDDFDGVSSAVDVYADEGQQLAIVIQAFGGGYATGSYLALSVQAY